jgi:hypothetical protein
MINWLFSLFYVVGAVRKLGFRLFINETSKKWRPVERMSCLDRDNVFDKIGMFSPDRHREY